MRITLSVLLAVLTIYCCSAVLSLPPSLIATSASLRQPRPKAATVQLQEEEQPVAAAATYGLNGLWKKDAAPFLLVGPHGPHGLNAERADNALDDIVAAAAAADQQRNLVESGLSNKQRKAAGEAAASANAARAAQQRNVELRRKLAAEYDLNALLATAAGAADLQTLQRQQQQDQQQQQQKEQQWLRARETALQANEFFTPLKYWARHCQPGNNCPPEYYRALFADRSRQRQRQQQQQQQSAAATRPLDEVAAAPATALHFVDNGGGGGVGAGVGEAVALAADDDVDGDDVVSLSGDGRFNNLARLDDVHISSGDDSSAANVNANDDDDTADNDILMLLNGEQDVMKFLSWAMEQLYPYQRAATNGSGTGRSGSNDAAADSNHPGMYVWKKLNMSGRLEPPLIVEEPRYIIVRREQLEEDLQSGSKYKDDPFIPPRGRKHNQPDLDALLNRYETFVPNRGRRDKIKDMFKYDDLFFPNRGKKQKPPKATALAAFSRECASNDNQRTGIAGDGASVDAAEGDQQQPQLVGNDLANGLVAVSPSSTVAMQRFWGQRHRRLRPRKCCWQLLSRNINSQAANEVSFDDDNSNKSNDDDNNSDGISDYQSGINSDYYDNTNSNTNSKSNSGGASSTRGRVPSYKPNEDDQSVKASMPAMPAIRATATTTTMAKWPAVAMPTAPLQQRWRSAFANTRLRRVAGTFAGAARVAANRYHSTSAMPQQHQRQQQMQRYQQQQQQQQRHEQRQYQHYRQQQQQQRHYWRHQRREHLQLQQQQPTTQQQQQQQQQEHVATWPGLSLPHHQLKSYDDLDLLLWRQLQLQQQKPLTWRHPRLSAPQQRRQSTQQRQQQQLGSWQRAQPQSQSQETQLANAAAAADDIDYLYVNI